MARDLKTKKIAAIAAVNAYLQDEEAAAAAALAAQAQPEPQAPGPPLWALSGRQEIMQMRRLIQMKAF